MIEAEVGDFNGEVIQTNQRRVTGEMSYSASFLRIKLKFLHDICGVLHCAISDILTL